MTRENLEILRNAYDALNRGEIDSALAVLEPDAEWHEHSDLPEADVYRGRERSARSCSAIWTPGRSSGRRPRS